MKKRVTYKPSVQIRTSCQVISATCTCPAGGTPAFCKHVFELLHAINDYITCNHNINRQSMINGVIASICCTVCHF
ncbi:hypothetical protein TNIN_368041 [Trichonephila inaurata madagascariensis]|uniref:SWIM-type domain-containing protein n=1 Tax=Trichonephila inaurata madagascariensis TaxID=2747483 RepID=A0A8X6XM16_9ARAC|nr:hypothetical protein TNIN_368041 [Trichonephila inaurata madagascariensis]